MLSMISSSIQEGELSPTITVPSGSSFYCLLSRRVYDQMRARMSPEPVAKKPPVGLATGLGATEMTEFLCPWSMSCVWPVRGSQNWTPRSLDPERTHSESGVSATLRTKSYGNY